MRKCRNGFSTPTSKAGCQAATPIPPPMSPPMKRKNIPGTSPGLVEIHHMHWEREQRKKQVNRGSSTTTEVEQDDQKVLEEVVDCIQGQLMTLPKVSRHHCIYRVPKPLRKTNEGAYTPVMVSIGPFHHKTERLLPMENYKHEYLQAFLNASSSRTDVRTYLQFVIENETKIRNCYANAINKITRKDFVKMALLDSVFIIELFRRFHNPTLRVYDHYIYGPSRKYIQIKQDITLAENQLPFFLLMEIYKIAYEPAKNHGVPRFTDLACKFFSVKCAKLNIDAHTNEAKCYHLLDFLRCHYLPSNCIEDDKPSDVEEEEEKVSMCKMLLHQRSVQSPVDHSVEMININREERIEREELKKCRDIVNPSATILHQAGVRFETTECEGPDLLDIRFEQTKGILTIPKLRVDNWTEVWFRNVLAFEQCHCLDNAYFTYYQRFMDFLINTPGDVKLLVAAGIIENFLGSDEDVCYLFNTFVKDAIFDHEIYRYGRISWKLNSHCQKKWNRHKATLKQKYFGHPWAVISVIYAILLLILTIAQVVLAVIPLIGKRRGN